jgi:hypothetical protein
VKDVVNGYENLARQIQSFMWEGKPFKSKKKEHTKEELEDFLDDIRQECWMNYDSGASELGWKE